LTRDGASKAPPAKKILVVGATDAIADAGAKLCDFEHTLLDPRANGAQDGAEVPGHVVDGQELMGVGRHSRRWFAQRQSFLPSTVVMACTVVADSTGRWVARV
jgi:hypothetical protein